MSTLGIVTARSGSKGVRDKNIRNLAGKPLIAYTIESALQSHYIDEVMVSTDSDVYAAIAKKYGANVPFLRSKINSADTANSMDVVFEVLDNYERQEEYFDNIILLQPTSPLRTYKNIDEAFELFYQKEADSVVSLCECEHSPMLCNTLPADQNIFEFINNQCISRRQDLQKYYRLNGAIYISKTNILRKTRSFYGKNSYAYVMEQEESIDIDSELDFKYVEFLITTFEEKHLMTWRG